MDFKIISDYTPAGDQPKAIKELIQGLNNGDDAQVLLGVTGSGKTFTMANVIQDVQRPTLVLTHNKTLVAQLYGEFKQFFPNNAVEYFVSYYDYYQPEAFISATNTYIEKEVSINEEIEKLRLRATTSLLSGRRDVILVSSVSCIYGMGNPDEFRKGIIRLSVGDEIVREDLLHRLVGSFYSRVQHHLNPGTFRVSGDTVDVHIPYLKFAYRIIFFGDEIEEICSIDPDSGKTIAEFKDVAIFPATIYVAPKDQMETIQEEIKTDMEKQVEYLKLIGQHLEAKRLEEKTIFDLEMMKEIGYCSGIENYSRYFDRREPGERPFSLLDYFPDDYLLMVDESHVSIPQIRGMYEGDRARKTSLVDNGFRLPSALDNRPLKFDEFYDIVNQSIYVSATPAAFELEQSGGAVVEQIIRPTGLLDPEIEVKPCKNQIDDLLEQIDERIKADERVLVTTLTKRMSEELTKYLLDLKIKSKYIHSEIHTLDRVEILRDLRLGEFDVLVGVNLLREGLDLPEVSLVAILDADKEGFLRSERSLTQVSGRAARNINGKVIMYADKITDSMRKTIDETNRRRVIQNKYNEDHGTVPIQLKKTKEQIMGQTSVLNIRAEKEYYVESDEAYGVASDPVADYFNEDQLNKLIGETKKKMKQAAKDMDFLEAARLRDEMFDYENRIKEFK
jgi:excinuclease ABC subunit B